MSDPVEQGKQVDALLPWRNRTMDEIEARFRDATTIPDVCGPNVCYAPNNAELGLIGLVMCERVRLLEQREKGLRDLLQRIYDNERVWRVLPTSIASDLAAVDLTSKTDDNVADALQGEATSEPDPGPITLESELTGRPIRDG